MELIELPDLHRSKDRYVLPRGRATAQLAALPAGAGDLDPADQIADFWVERDVLGTAKHCGGVGQPKQGESVVLTENGIELAPGLSGVNDESLNARSLAMRVRRVGRGAVEDNSSKQTKTAG